MLRINDNYFVVQEMKHSYELTKRVDLEQKKRSDLRARSDVARHVIAENRVKKEAIELRCVEVFLYYV